MGQRTVQLEEGALGHRRQAARLKLVASARVVDLRAQVRKLVDHVLLLVRQVRVVH